MMKRLEENEGSKERKGSKGKVEKGERWKTQAN